MGAGKGTRPPQVQMWGRPSALRSGLQAGGNAWCIQPLVKVSTERRVAHQLDSGVGKVCPFGKLDVYKKCGAEKGKIWGT